MRELTRSVAKARLEAMGIPHVNKVMGLGMRHNNVRKLQKTSFGRKMLDEIREKHVALWRRVTTGSLVEEAYKAQMGIGKRKKYAIAK